MRAQWSALGTNFQAKYDLIKNAQDASTVVAQSTTQLIQDWMNGKNMPKVGIDPNSVQAFGTAVAQAAKTGNWTPSDPFAGLPTGSTITIKTAAFGGFIRGPGTSMSDSIPAMLSNGEYVINAAAVAAHGVSFFDAINFGGAGVGTVSTKAANRMSMGGSVGSGAASKTNNIQYNINVSVQGTNSSPDDIANKVMATIKQQQRINTTRRDI